SSSRPRHARARDRGAPMPIAVHCPRCGTQYSLADEQRGKRVLCRECSEPFYAEETDHPPPPPRPAPRAHDGPPRDREPDGRLRRGPGGGMLLLWLALGGGVLLLSAAGFVAVFLWGGFGPDRVTPQNYTQLRLDMTEAEVVAILGPGEDVTR